MKIFADENIPAMTVRELRAAGHEGFCSDGMEIS